MRQFAVFGLGRFGYKLAVTLMMEGGEVIAVDSNPELVERIKDQVTQAVRMDSTSEEALNAIGVREVDYAIVCIGDNMEANILTALLLKKIGVPMVIARANSQEHGQILKLIGANEVVSPEEEMGERIAKRLTSAHIIQHIELADGHVLTDIRAGGKLASKTIVDLNLRARYGVNIVAVKKRVPDVTEEGENIFVEKIYDVPDPKDVIEEEDVLVVVGKEENIEELRRLLRE